MKKEKRDKSEAPLRPPFQTGVIDIGAHSVRLDIYELDRFWRMERLETLSRPLNLGTDVFRNGFISAENVSKLLNIADRFREKLAEYDVGYFQVIATSALREAFNKELIADRFRDIGMELEIIGGTNEATLTYQAAKEVLQDKCKNSLSRAVMLILGSGSLFVIGIVNSLMCFCEEVPTGTMRISDAIGNAAPPLEQLRESLKSLRILRRLDECMPAGKAGDTSLVIIGNTARKLASLGGNAPGGDDDCAVFEYREFGKLLKDCSSMEKKRFRKLDADETAELNSACVIIEHFFEHNSFKDVICPGVTTRGALMKNWIRKQRNPADEPFRADLAAVCSAVGKKYDFDAEHARCVAAASAKLYAKLHHCFSFPDNSALLLEAAAYLHDIGRFVDIRKHQKHSWYLVANTQLPGISDSEHRVIAAMVRYHGKSMPRENHPEYSALSASEKVAVLKLAAILRVADALDVGHEQDWKSIKCVLRGRIFYIIVEGADIVSKKYALKLKGGLFEQVFGLELKIQDSEI